MATPDEETPSEGWTDGEVFTHCQATFDNAVNTFPDIMEPYVVMLVEASDQTERLAIMRRGLMGTISNRYPIRTFERAVEMGGE